jgi:hypothetical protein
MLAGQGSGVNDSVKAVVVQFVCHPEQAFLAQ